jgi:hypothetical protein
MSESESLQLPLEKGEEKKGTVSRIEGWQFVTFPGADGVVEGKLNLVGEIYNHEGVPHGAYRMTSRVQVINKPGELVQTRSGTVYSLGEPRKEWMESMGYGTKEAAIWGMVSHALELRLIPPAPFEKGGE